MSFIKDLISPSVEAPEAKKEPDLEDDARSRASAFRRKQSTNSDQRQTDSGLRL